MPRLPGGPTGHVDTFCRELLPPAEISPEMDYSHLSYPARLNCAADLPDAPARWTTGRRTNGGRSRRRCSARGRERGARART